MQRLRSMTCIAVTLAAIAACDKGDAEKQREAPRAEPQHVAPPAVSSAPAPQPAPSAQAAALPTVELKLASVGNTMAYDKTSLTVAAGQKVHVVLISNSTIEAMPHNWVLGTLAADAAAVAAAGLKLGPAAGYVDPEDKNVLAHTPLAGPGKTVEVTFTAPAAPGTYPFFCTAPGHYLTMKGKLIVTA